MFVILFVSIVFFNQSNVSLVFYVYLKERIGQTKFLSWLMWHLFEDELSKTKTFPMNLRI